MIYLVRGVAVLTLLICWTVISSFLVFVLAFVRVIVLFAKIREVVSGMMDGVITGWVGFNSILVQVLGVTKIQTHVEGDLTDRSNWWVVTSNHQSWADIIIIQTALLHLAPPIKFFTKRELIWIPLLGLAMWLLRFPYVRRSSKKETPNNKSLFKKNRQSLGRVAGHFQERPISLLVFLEGTRFTEEKHKARRSPYKNLLSPRIGGLGFALSQLDDRVHKIVDLTLNYSGTVPMFWHFLCGRCRTVDVYIRSYDVDESFREDLRNGVSTIWQQKDELLEQIRGAV